MIIYVYLPTVANSYRRITAPFNDDGRRRTDSRGRPTRAAVGGASRLLAGEVDLVRSLDVSRSTVDRAVRRLESEGIVERRASGYGLTLVGRLVYEEYLTFTERTTGLLDAAPVFEALPADTPLDPAAHSVQTSSHRSVQRRTGPETGIWN